MPTLADTRFPNSVSTKLPKLIVSSPCFPKLVKEGLNLVDADGNVAGVVQSLLLGDSSEDVGEVVHQLAEGDRDGWLFCATQLLVFTF